MTKHPGDYIAIDQVNRLACGQDGETRLGAELGEARRVVTSRPSHLAALRDSLPWVRNSVP